MNNISRKGLEVKAILAPILPSLFLELASNFSRNIFLGVMLLLILGVVVGLNISTIVSTWFILILTVLGISSLTFGYATIDFYGKTLLLASLPLETYLTNRIKECVFRWRMFKGNQSGACRYLKHYDQNVKLQTIYNAEKLYKKIKRILTEKNYLPLWCDSTIIDWEHDQQFAQFNLEGHNKILQQIARVLKTSRLAGENLYYLGNGQFLITSNTIAPGTLMVLNDRLKAELKRLRYGEYRPAFKMVTQHITEQDPLEYPNFNAILKRLKRKFETDLIVEHLKGIEA